MTVLRLFVSGVIALAASLGARAQAPVVFTEISPAHASNSPNVLQVVVHPLDDRRLIATDSNQVLVTSDGGTTWRKAGSLPGRPERLFAHPGRPGVVFLQGATAHVGIGHQRHKGYAMMSTDFGESWSALADARLDEALLVMSPFASVPTQPERLFGTRRIVNVTVSSALGIPPSPEVSLVESLDGGKSWGPTATFPLVTRGGIRSTEGPTPATPTRVFVTTEDDGSYVSSDGGRSWSAFPQSNGRFFRFWQDPANASTIYAAAEVADTGRGIVRSMDGGQSWQLIYPMAFDSPFHGVINYGGIAIDPVRTSRLWLTTVKAGVLLSEDRGATWRGVDLRCSPAPCTDIDFNSFIEPGVVSVAGEAQAYLIWRGSLFRGALPTRNRVAVEYQYGDRFWITGDAAEAVSQDYRANEAERTGRSFGLWSAADAPAGAMAVCRFQGRAARGQTSRFISLADSECDIVKRSGAFNLEGEGEYFAMPTSSDGGCAASFVPVHRFNNLQPNVNHRYVADLATADQMRAAGWYDEGVRFCARPIGSDE